MTSRGHVLRDLGAKGAVLEELLVATDSGLSPSSRAAETSLPLEDEAHLSDWDDYMADARTLGVVEALARRLVQLRFPIEAGISARPDYRAATRRGVFPEGEAPGVSLQDAQAIELVLHRTPGGRIPILTVPNRRDFATLVQAFSCRNEPETVPESMGACIVTGLNNWDRVLRHRRRFEEAGGAGEEAWAAEFERLKPQKGLYQDRFLILSTGPYSAVSAEALHMGEEDWLGHSLAIRREHECTHYLTHRVFGVMRNSLKDELIADFVGLVRAFERYDASVARLFLGVEEKGVFRAGGRLGNYRGTPPVSDEAFLVLCALARRATLTLERAARDQGDRLLDPMHVARLALELYAAPMEELGRDDFRLGGS